MQNDLRKWILLVESDTDDDDIWAGLTSLRRRHYRLDFDLMYDHNTIHLELISVPNEKQGRGLGTSAMQDLVSFADEHGLAIDLEAQSYKKFNRTQIGQRALENWYARFGFRKTGERSAEGHPILVRSASPLK